MVEKPLYVIPCNGLDKNLGQVAREIALACLQEGIEVVCPVLAQAHPEEYRERLEGAQTIVIDGCATRCATKVAGDLKVQVARKVFVPDEIKQKKIIPEKSLFPGEESKRIAHAAADDLKAFLARKAEKKDESQVSPESAELKALDYYEHMQDKFLFRVPKEGFYFTENDSWVRPISDTIGLIGISDFMQQYLADIMYVEPADVDRQFEQFDEISAVESTKSVYQIISPVTCKMVEANKELEANPHWVNEDPYVKGWIAKVELQSLEDDKELLLDCAAYFEKLKVKVAEEHGKH